MEFQEAIMKLMIHKAKENEWAFQTTDRVTEISNPSPRRKWKLFHRSSSAIPSKTAKAQAPKEFICPVSGSLMADPVIVSSGHTFERACVQVCKALNFTPTLVDSSPPDYSSVISNLALKSAILNWCHKSSIDPPKPLDFSSADQLVRAFMASQNQTQPQKLVILENELLIQGVNETPKVNFNHAATEVTRRSTHFHSSSDESVTAPVLTPPLPFSTQPSCYSSPSSSSSEIETLNPGNSNSSFRSVEDDEILIKLRSPHLRGVG